ncbi:fibronectin type III domain-containing protein [Desulforhopalus sp. 52FAK]
MKISQTDGMWNFVIFIAILFCGCASNSLAKSYSFSWAENTDPVEGYNLYYKKGGDAGPPFYGEDPSADQLPINVGKTDNYTIEGLEDNVTYHFALTAYNGSDESDYTDVITVFPAATTDDSSEDNSTPDEITQSPSVDPPAATDSIISGSEDTPVSGFVVVDSREDFTLQLTGEPQYGSVTIDNTTGGYTYTPDVDFFGEDVFTFSARNSGGDSNPASVTVTILNVNDPPDALAVSVATDEDTPLSAQLPASDADGDSLNYLIVSAPAHGTLTTNTDGYSTYIPDENWNGTDSFTFVVSDSTTASDSANVSITVLPVNDKPTASNINVDTIEGSTISGQLSAIDIDGDQLSFALSSKPANGSVSLSKAGTFTYTPDADWWGTDTFTYIASDNIGVSSPATVSINVTQKIDEFTYELVEIAANSSWQQILLTNSFINPVVIAKTTSFNNEEPGVIRVKNITASSLELRFQEWDSYDDVHPQETVTVLIVEAGSFILENGAMVEADCFPSSAVETFSAATFLQAMNDVPVVVTTINSVNESDAVTLRIKNVDSGGFEFKLQEQEANASIHLEENVCYLAWEPSVGAIGELQFEVARTEPGITHDISTIAYTSRFVEQPFILVNQQTTNGVDTAVLTSNNVSIQGQELCISEEQSLDLEIEHVAEAGGYIAFASNIPTDDPDGDGLSTEDEDKIYGTHPGLIDSDQDGIDDGSEVNMWTSFGSAWNLDIDQDGAINLLDPDADNDGITDGDELATGRNPASSETEVQVQGVSLHVNTYKWKGKGYAELTWSGIDADNVVIYNNGTVVDSITNRDTYTHGPLKIRKPETYQVCGSDTAICSDEITVNW